MNRMALAPGPRDGRTSLAIDVGVAQVDESGATQSKLLAQLLLTREVTPFQSVFMSVGQQYTDAADSFASGHAKSHVRKGSRSPQASASRMLK